MRCKYYGNCYAGTLLTISCFDKQDPCIHEDAQDAVALERKEQKKKLLEYTVEDAMLQIREGDIYQAYVINQHHGSELYVPVPL